MKMKKNEPHLLMCPPDHYEIRYVINPWMKLTRQSDPEKAHLQWKKLCDILNSLNCNIHTVQPVRGLPDMVFTANAGFPVGRRVFLSRFRHKEREAEAGHFRGWFEKNGFEVIDLPEKIFLRAQAMRFLSGTRFLQATVSGLISVRIPSLLRNWGLRSFLLNLLKNIFIIWTPVLPLFHQSQCYIIHLPLTVTEKKL